MKIHRKLIFNRPYREDNRIPRAKKASEILQHGSGKGQGRVEEWLRKGQGGCKPLRNPRTWVGEGSGKGRGRVREGASRGRCP